MVESSKKDVSGIIALFFVIIIFVYFALCPVVENFQKQDPKLEQIRKTIRPLRPDIVDRITFLEDKRSYTINKQKIYLCLKDENGDYYQDNMLIFVVLHEMAHVMCDEIGHTAKFQQIFQQLLDEATVLKIYDPSIQPIQNYCEY
jgi:hypothetical protein